MAAKNITYGIEAREQVLNGVATAPHELSPGEKFDSRRSEASHVSPGPI